MKSSSEAAISVASSTRKLDVDNRISLRSYYRIADTILKQADIYREEKNIIDLYVMLLRFSSLITETIPLHRDYRASLQRDKLHFKKRLLDALLELEAIKPDVQRRLDELNSKSWNQVTKWNQSRPNVLIDSSLEWPSVKKQTPGNNEFRQPYRIAGPNGFSRDPVSQQNMFLQSKPIDQQFNKLSLNIPRPTEETLSRHSILGPNGLSGKWQSPIIDRGVRYPSNLDLTPVVIPSLQPAQDKRLAEKETGNLERERSALEEVLSLQDDMVPSHAEEPAMIRLDVPETPTISIIREPSPPPVLAEVHEHVAVGFPVGSQESGQMTTLQDELLHSESPSQVHFSTTMMDYFMRLAKSNTDRNLETCGLLAGSLKNKKFYISALIIPKQESTSDSCQATNEEEIFEYQDKHSLFPLGWIHTHPSQSCFMSSIDIHTHYSYQTMLPEAIAIVMAPKDSSRKHGIFRLTVPGGMSVIRKCEQRGFHPHEDPPEGGPIYDHCSDVYMNPKLKFDVVDLR